MARLEGPITRDRDNAIEWQKILLVRRSRSRVFTMAANEEDRKNLDPPVKLIAKIEDLGVLSSVDDAKRNGETCGGGDTKASKKAIIVEKSTGAPLVTVRSRRSIMESRFRLTLKTWDDVWRSTSWAKNPPKQIKMAVAANQDGDRGGDKNVAHESQNGRLDSIGGADTVNASYVEVAQDDNVPPQSKDEEVLRKTVSDTNVSSQESSERQPMLHIATDEDIAVRDREAVASAVKENATGESALDQVACSTNVVDNTSAKEENEEAIIATATAASIGVDEVDGGGAVEDAVLSSPGPLPKKIKNTRFMVVPSVQVPVSTPSEAEETNNKEEATGTAASSDSEDTSSSNRNSASRNRVPMFESRLNELTMVESQLKKLDFKPMHLELPEDRDSDDSASSKTITAAEGKALKIREAIPPRRNNSLEGAYPPLSKKKSSKGGTGVADVSKPSWNWLSIFRRKPSAQQITTSSSTSTSSSSSKMSSTPAPTSGQGRSGTTSAGRSTSGHQARSRQQQRQTTTVANARRAAAAAASAQQQNAQANARIILIQVSFSFVFFIHHCTINYAGQEIFSFFFSVLQT